MRAVDMLVVELRASVRELGERGGLISPSVYDTARGLLSCPPRDRGAAVNWLMAQQAGDGGWGRTDAPLVRHVPTLAAILALHSIEPRAARDAVSSGLEFLKQCSLEWRAPLPEDIPVGVELLLPKLLEEAAARDLAVSPAPYEALLSLGRRRRELIEKSPRIVASQAIHTWEAWGGAPDPSLLSHEGGLGDSPAATAVFWDKADGHPDLHDARARARRYLERAAEATGEELPGVVPTVWPINRFEQSFALYALCTAGIVDHPALREAVDPQLADLRQALNEEGLASSDAFIPDGDDTAAAIVALRSAGRSVDLAPLRRFEEHGHFCTWPHELQPSISVNARAIQALALFGEDVSGPRRFILERQRADGRWSGDKWNSSWIYTTALVVVALAARGEERCIEAGVRALLAAQHDDGGWGAGQRPTSAETAWCVLALQRLLPLGIERQGLVTALRRALRFLLANHRSGDERTTRWWLAKENYGTPRLDRVIALSAMLSLALNEETGAEP